MSAVVREVAGWAVLVIGLVCFWRAYLFLLDRRVFEAGPMAFIGFVVFRGGLHLLKVAVAARAAKAVPAAGPAPRRSFAGADRTAAPTDPRRAVPGPRAGGR